jgi:DNA segregation ATPase FtsK/SpoIIIE-like protein
VVNRLDSHDGLMDKVHYRQIMEVYPKEHQSNFTVCVGVGLYRITKWVNFAHYPHWLIAGWTGGGKSNIVNVIISTLITHHSPDELRLVLLDLKGGVEFGSYQGIPHLIGNVIEDIEQISGVLEQLEAVMADRLKLLRAKGVKVIEDYNRRTDKPLPRIIVFFDEFAAVTGQGDTTRRIKASLQQIVAKGRAIGIHVVASTQTPNVDTIPGIIKTNLSVRLVGRMPTSSASVTALGSGDASDLAAIPGRMIMMISEPEPIQTPLIDDDDIHDAIAIAKQFPAPKIPLELPAGRTHQQWTPERLIEFSLKHMGGNIAGTALYEAIQDENLSRAQVFALVEKILEMPSVSHNGKTYCIENRGKRTRYLTEVKEDSNLVNFPSSSVDVSMPAAVGMGD